MERKEQWVRELLEIRLTQYFPNLSVQRRSQLADFLQAKPNRKNRDNKELGLLIKVIKWDYIPLGNLRRKTLSLIRILEGEGITISDERKRQILRMVV